MEKKHSPEEILLAIEQFLNASRRPSLIEPGEEPFSILPDSSAIEVRGDCVLVQVWDEKRNLSRRVTGIHGSGAGRLDLAVQKFGKAGGAVQLIDGARPKNETVTRRASRLTFREQFRRSLGRQFPGWRIAELSTEPDLTHSLSPAYPRALLRKGNAGIAAISATPADTAPDHALSFGLIWLAYLRRREPQIRIETLAVFVPEPHVRNTCLRVRWLDPDRCRCLVFAYGDHHEEPADVADIGNMDTRLPVLTQPRQAGPPALENAECIQKAVSVDGAVSYRVHGLEFARMETGGALHYGLETKRAGTASNVPEILALARELARLRGPSATDRNNDIFRRYPELWLESQVRLNLGTIEASLDPGCVYSQAPTFAASERDVIDLLAIGHTGQLSVVEIKASQDLHLPLQALDYWMRVKWHLDRDDFTARGYFPGKRISRAAPKIWLVAPSLEFHPSTETILGFFSAGIEVERVGLAMNWQEQVRVVFRARGANEPS